MVRLSDGLDMTIAVDWGVKPHTKLNNDVISPLEWLEFRC